MTTKTQEEIDAMTPEEIAAWRANEERTVFGYDFQRNRQGQPVEQGIGSPGHETENHFKALEKAEGRAVADRARAAAAARRK